MAALLLGARRSRPVLAVGLGCAFMAACSSGNDITSGAGGSSGSAAAGTTSSSAGTLAIAGTGPSVGGSTNLSSGGGTVIASGGSTGGGESGGTSSGGASGGTSGGPDNGFGGSSAGAGGSVSSGGASAGSAGAGSTACPTGAAFCDDFEAGAALGSAWSVDNTLGATVKVVSTFTTTPGPTMAHSGKNAVQISFMGGTSGYAMIVDKMGFPAAPAAAGYWGRVWMYIETPASDAGHDVYIEGSTGMNLGNQGARPLNTQKGLMTINIDPVGTGEAGANSPTPIPRGAWTCFEWQISATGGTGNIVLYAGGSMTPTVSLNGKPIEALVEQRVGYERFGNGADAGNVWVDDYAIGSMRLGCK